MSNDSNPSNPAEPLKPPEHPWLPPGWEPLMEIMQEWMESTTSLQHTLLTVKEFLGLITRHEEKEARDLEEARQSVTAMRVLLEENQKKCQTALSTYTRFQGTWGKVQWLLQEFNERPKGIYRLIAVTGIIALLASLLGLDVPQMLRSALAGLVK